jgi:hypothetical protein
MNKESKILFSQLLLIFILILVVAIDFLSKKSKLKDSLIRVDLSQRKIHPSIIKQYPGLEFLSEDEANEISEGLFQLSLITMKIYGNREI